MPAVVGDGSAQLAALGLRLKVMGAGALRLELLRGLKAATKPVEADLRRAASTQLPKSGGLAQRVSTSPVKTSVRLAGRNASVRVYTTEHDTRSTNRGVVRHPVFGHRDRWVAQEIPTAKDWADNAVDRQRPEATAAMYAVMQAVAAQIQGRL